MKPTCEEVQALIAKPLPVTTAAEMALIIAHTMKLPCLICSEFSKTILCPEEDAKEFAERTVRCRKDPELQAILHMYDREASS